MLAITGVSKRFGDVTALDECTFVVPRGRILGFLGPNGAGKTTAMRAVLGLVRPDAGSIMWDGRPVDDATRRTIGYMPEQRGLYPKMRVRDQLGYLGELHGMRRGAALVAADHWLGELGLTDRGRDSVESLSHGNQQRIQLAAALVHDPEILILDEPFSGLDPLGVEALSDVLRARAAAGAAVVFSSHQLDLVEDVCEEVAIINAGRIVATGPLDEIKEESPHRVVEIELDDPGGFGADLAGVVSRTVTANRLRLVLAREVGIEQVLDAVRGAGGVRRLVYSTPPLTQIFLEAVS